MNSPLPFLGFSTIALCLVFEARFPELVKHGLVFFQVNFVVNELFSQLLLINFKKCSQLIKF